MGVISLGRPDPEEARALSARGFGQERSPHFDRNVDETIEGGSIHYTASHRDVAVGFAALSVYEHQLGKILYLNGIMIDPVAQSSGLAREIIGLAVSDFPAQYFGFRTQSVRMYVAASKIVPDLYPQITHRDEAIPTDITAVGEFIANVRGMDFPLQVGAYGRPLYGTRPGHALAEIFYGLLDYERGDALVCVGRIP